MALTKIHFEMLVDRYLALHKQCLLPLENLKQIWPPVSESHAAVGLSIMTAKDWCRSKGWEAEFDDRQNHLIVGKNLPQAAP